MAVVYLDSNIYRQMGLKFKENRDYTNLLNTLHSTAANFGLLEVVLEELLDHYKNEVFASLSNDHANLQKRYEENPYLENLLTQSLLVEQITSALQKIEVDIRENAFFTRLPPNISSKSLLAFCLENKRTAGRKDNTRDLLIFLTILHACIESRTYRGEFHVLITDDKIFSTNSFFKRLLVDEKVANFKTYSSIAEFLKDYGPKLDYITPEKALAAVDKSMIKKELLKDINSLPSYVSGYYNHVSKSKVPKLETLEINDIKISVYYIYRDFESGALHIHIAVTVFVKVIFKPDKNFAEVINYIITSPESIYDSSYSHTFDKEGRPIYDSSILFTFDGTINELSQQIENVTFLDFMPDYFIYVEPKKKYSKEEFIQFIKDSI